jgi:hypothetical protein
MGARISRWRGRVWGRWARIPQKAIRGLLPRSAKLCKGWRMGYLLTAPNRNRPYDQETPPSAGQPAQSPPRQTGCPRDSARNPNSGSACGGTLDVSHESLACVDPGRSRPVARASRGCRPGRHYRAGRSADHRRPRRGRRARAGAGRAPKPLPGSHRPSAAASDRIPSHDRRSRRAHLNQPAGDARLPGRRYQIRLAPYSLRV